ncbi:MAG: hypothetical protein J1F11_06185 [Oscillospiraceae bacterium]|nr:hypothetical protein [Oscillospiraceae bacterium]
MKELLIITAEMSLCGTAAFLLYLLTVHSSHRHLSSGARFVFLKAAALLFVLPVSKLLSPLLSLTAAPTVPDAPVAPSYTVPTQFAVPDVPVQNILPPAAPTPPAAPDVPAVVRTAANSTHILTVLAIIWITGIAAIFIWRIICRLRFEHEIKPVLSPADEDIMSVYRSCCESMGVSSAVPVYVCEKVSTPMIVGAVRPRILLPKKEISQKSLEFVFRHELTHYKRRDIFAKMFVSLVNMLHWFNPLVYVFDREFISMLELSCDERAGLALDSDGRKDYCKAILETVPVKRSDHIGLIFCTSGKKKLKQRLDNILRFREMPLSRKIIAGVAAAAIIGVSCAVVAMFIPVDRTAGDDLYVIGKSDETDISDYSDNLSSADDSSDAPDVTVPDKTDPEPIQTTTDEQALTTTEQVQDTADEQSLPDFYVPYQIMSETGHLIDLDRGLDINSGEDPAVLISFALPEEWSFNGSSVADVGDTKVFEIGAVFPSEEFSPEKVTPFDMDTEFPAVIETTLSGHRLTVYEQELGDSGLYDFMEHSSVLLYTGDYETYDYIVSRNGWSTWVIFVVTEYFSEDIVETVLRSVNITTVEQLPAELEREVTGLLDGFILTQDFLFTEPPSSGNETAEYNGREYYKIIDERYDTWDEWSALFHSIYTDEFADNLLNNFDTVVNINGETYSNGGSRGSDVDNNYSYTVIFANDNEMIIDMTRGYYFEGYENSFEVDRLRMVRTDAGWRIELSGGWKGQAE